MTDLIQDDLRSLEDTSSALKALHSLIVKAMEAGEELTPEATGVYHMFRDYDERLEHTGQQLRQHAKSLKARMTDAWADRPTDLDLLDIDPHSGQGARRKLVRAVLRLTNYAYVAERYALPAETFRDMLYGLIDAPQKEMKLEGLREVGTGPESDKTEYEPPLRASDLGPIPEHFMREALAARLAGSDTEKLAKAVNLKPETVQRVIDQLLAEPSEPPAATGTDSH
jgi:hypothetical protein